MEYSKDVIECLNYLIDNVTATKTTPERNENFVCQKVEIGNNFFPALPVRSLPSDSDTDDDDVDENSSSETAGSSEEKEVAKICMKGNKQEETNSISQVASIFKELLIQDNTDCKDSMYQLPPGKTLKPVGKISKIIENSLVVVVAYENVPALNLDTLIFLQNRKVFGKILETFGPVILPHYVVTINPTEISAELEEEVFFVPECDDVTSFVLTSQLQRSKGSDASWLGDSEPPVECLDYSDDEQERNAKRCKRKAKPPPTKVFSPQPSNPRYPQQHAWHNVSTNFQRGTNFNTHNFPAVPHQAAYIHPSQWVPNQPPFHRPNPHLFPRFNTVCQNGNYRPFFNGN
uniref:H/ACA ribonucleoprotein complex subunit n=1 Tax=Phallusia mammillata TaxID=59560 RepID=A0A6F9DMC7_9ASCI|nr:H/ACA ribonucleoprotein complex non-core subunit NAF1 [Phallusia mammillata]